jgi:hypothetical protein
MTTYSQYATVRVSILVVQPCHVAKEVIEIWGVVIQNQNSWHLFTWSELRGSVLYLDQTTLHLTLLFFLVIGAHKAISKGKLVQNVSRNSSTGEKQSLATLVVGIELYMHISFSL